VAKVVTDYLGEVFNSDLFQSMVERAIRQARILKQELGFEAIAFTGTSGSAIAYILGYTLDVPLICIRKEGENTHYRTWDERHKHIEGYVGAKSYLIVDDFISSGKTVDRIMNVIEDNCPECKCVGMLMYQQSERKKDFFSRNENRPGAIPVFSCKKDSWDSNGY
jgi:adenine/guanine phosphoribosyltransferase-like PRPP-binding protein